MNSKTRLQLFYTHTKRQTGRSIAKELNVTDSRIYIIKRESTKKIKSFVAGHAELREVLSDMNYNI